MILDLTPDEVQSIFNVLGQLPTSSGAFPLMVKIKMQAEAQVAAKIDTQTEEKPVSD